MKTTPSNPAARLLARLLLVCLFAASTAAHLGAQPVASGAVPASASATRVGTITVRFNGPANVAEQVVRANMQLQEGSP